MSVKSVLVAKSGVYLYRKSLDPTAHVPSRRKKVNMAGVLYRKKQKRVKNSEMTPHFSLVFILPRSFVQFLSQI